MSGNELVLSVRKSDLPAAWVAETASIPMSWDVIADYLSPVEPLWMPRSSAESLPEFKQIIPYVLSMCGDGLFAVYPRKGSESRLHGLWSAGAGGHVNPCDASIPFSWRDTIGNGAERELREEFQGLQSIPELTPLGLVNEELSKVGEVHLGLVFIAVFQCSNPPMPDTELNGLRWIHPDASSSEDFPLELWSELALKLLK